MYVELGLSEYLLVVFRALSLTHELVFALSQMLGGDTLLSQARKPEIMADAAHAILVKPLSQCSGNFFIDDDVLRKEGVKNFDQCAFFPSNSLSFSSSI